MADAIFMKSNRESHAVLRCLRRAENSYPLKFLSNETRENRNEEEASQKRSFIEMYAKYIVCKLLQVLQHTHLHLAIFYPSYITCLHSNSCSSATFVKYVYLRLRLELRVDDLLFSKLLFLITYFSHSFFHVNLT